MNLQELSNLLIAYTNKHYAKQNQQPFFQLMRDLSLRGMGIGIGANPYASGETGIMRFVRDALKKQFPAQPWTLFDVGANIGQFLVEVMKVFDGQDCRYYCFEPAPQAFASLKIRFARASAVSLFNIALGDIEEKRMLYSNTPTSAIASLYDRNLAHIGLRMRPMATVQVHTLDQFVSEQKIERIHFLKLDVEGHELKCLQGARKTLDAGRIQFIQFEMGGTNIDARTFFKDFWLALPNYSIRRILRDGFHEISAYNEADELFLPQNYLACLKA